MWEGNGQSSKPERDQQVIDQLTAEVLELQKAYIALDQKEVSTRRNLNALNSSIVVGRRQLEQARTAYEGTIPKDQYLKDIENDLRRMDTEANALEHLLETLLPQLKEAERRYKDKFILLGDIGKQ